MSQFGLTGSGYVGYFKDVRLWHGTLKLWNEALKLQYKPLAQAVISKTLFRKGKIDLVTGHGCKLTHLEVGHLNHGEIALRNWPSIRLLPYCYVLL